MVDVSVNLLGKMTGPIIKLPIIPYKKCDILNFTHMFTCSQPDMISISVQVFYEFPRTKLLIFSKLISYRQIRSSYIFNNIPFPLKGLRQGHITLRFDYKEHCEFVRAIILFRAQA